MMTHEKQQNPETNGGFTQFFSQRPVLIRGKATQLNRTLVKKRKELFN